jgi:hypothetical protein
MSVVNVTPLSSERDDTAEAVPCPATAFWSFMEASRRFRDESKMPISLPTLFRVIDIFCPKWQNDMLIAVRQPERPTGRNRR